MKTFRLCLAALVAAVTLTTLFVSDDDGSASAAAAQKIAFIGASTDPGGVKRLELYLINADGSGERRLVETARFSPTTAHPYGFGAPPAWSPDGRKIAYGGMADDGNADVYVVGADGLGQQRLTRHPKVDGNPAWSPDGRKIAFTRAARGCCVGKTYIYVMNADGSKQRRLAHGHVHFSVAWSPDGQKMLFERPNPRHPAPPVPGDATEDLHVMNADGSGQRNLTRNPAMDRDPHWSPDGRRIAFDSGSQIWVMNPNGSGKRSLTPARWWGSESLDWSPDGRKIAFKARPSTPPPGIYVMNADGSERRRLAEDGGSPAWSPDGKMIAFDRHGDIYVMNADGSGKQRLTRTDGGLSQVLEWAWSPAQK